MGKGKKLYDVFISHSANDAPLAGKIADACRASGLEPVSDRDLLPDDEASNLLWEALAESQALLAVLSPSGPTASMGIEIGAARAWNKPIYAVPTEPSLTRLPAGLSGIPVYPPGRIGDLVEAIKLSGEPLTEEDRERLAKVFSKTGASVDQLALDAKRLQELVRRFNAHRHKSVSGERLLSELLRMRKQGRLSKHRSGASPKPRTRTA